MVSWQLQRTEAAKKGRICQPNEPSKILWIVVLGGFEWQKSSQWFDPRDVFEWCMLPNSQVVGGQGGEFREAFPGPAGAC